MNPLNPFLILGHLPVQKVFPTGNSHISRHALASGFCLFVFVLCLAANTALSQDAAYKKIAFVVGVSEYQKDGLPNLRYAAKDAEDLSAELKRQGFEVTTLTSEQATQANVEERFAAFIESAGRLGKDDLVLVAFSGHGVQKAVIVDGADSEIPYFCVYDTLVTDPATMIPLNGILGQLEKGSGSSSNMLLVDACRDNPDKGAARTAALDGGTIRNLPPKISILFSSSPGSRSYESYEREQGIFTHVLLDGLRGKAANSRGDVDWVSLAAYTMNETSFLAPQLLGDPNAQQRPNLVGNLLHSPVLSARIKALLLTAPFSESEGRMAQKAWATAKGTEVEVTNSIGMKFALIPPGTFEMGSPETELHSSGGEHSDDEQLHTVMITRPFLMGIHEVTQGQYERVIGNNPSCFSAGGDYNHLVTGIGTNSFPVENVSWEEAQAFVDRLNELEGERGVRYRLPTEAEWEYACRAGTKSVFHFGPSLNGDHANCDGSFPYGTEGKGKYLERTARVGSYGANAFGLYDMHGNVWEWCEDWYGEGWYGESPPRDPNGPGSGSSRVLRGGSWYNCAAYCRSANRSANSPSGRSSNAGFRVVRLLE